MAEPADFAGSNSIERGDPASGVGDLHTFRKAGHGVISRWKLTPAEKRIVAETGDVWVQVATDGPVQALFISGYPLLELQDEAGGVIAKYDPDAPPQA